MRPADCQWVFRIESGDAMLDCGSCDAMACCRIGNLRCRLAIAISRRSFYPATVEKALDRFVVSPVAFFGTNCRRPSGRGTRDEPTAQCAGARCVRFARSHEPSDV